MAIATPTQLASVNSNTSTQTTWATGSITFPTASGAVLGLMLLHVSGYTGAVSLSVADSGGNTWTVITGATASTAAGSAAETTAIAYFMYPAGGSNTTVTVTATFASCNERMGWCGYTTGHDTTTPQDASGNATTGTGVSSITVTTSGNLSANDELVLVAWGDAAGVTVTPTWPTTSYTQLIAAMVDSVRHRSAAFEYQILTGGSGATQSTTVSYGTNSASTASIATFKPAATGTSYNDSGSGTITFTGSSAETQTHTASAAGTLTLSGTKTDSFLHTATATGTIAFTGASAETHAHTAAASGSLVLSGSSSESNSQIPTDTGWAFANLWHLLRLRRLQ